MKIIFKRTLYVFLVLTLLLAFSALLPSKNNITVKASSANPFENTFTYDLKNINQLAPLSTIEDFITMDELYDVVKDVNVNDNYYGKINELSNTLNNSKILNFILDTYPNYIASPLDWILAPDSNNNEIVFEFNGSNWINKGVFNLDNTITNNITSLVGNKRIAISSANDLYNLGNMASINFNRQGRINSYIFSNTIKKVLSLNYVVLNDIDYSSKKAQRFVPLGTNINVEMGDNSLVYDFPFTGEFDGNGYKIKNLYFADLSYISTTFQDDASSAITSALFEHYAMFTNIGSTGVVKNFILENPFYDLIIGTELVGLYKTAMVAGLNKGLIYNVGVIDKKRTLLGDSNDGISIRIPLASIDDYTASGFVYDNEGSIYNSFLSSNHVLSEISSNNRFSRIEAFVFNNSGTLNGVSYLTGIQTKQALNNNLTNLANYSEAQYRAGKILGNPINLNNQTLTNERYDEWYYYEEDGYPSLHGLTYDVDHYNIYDEYDLMTFSMLLGLSSTVNGKTFDKHNYVLKHDINMENIKGYKPISSDFGGTLTSDGDTKYIYNLNITTPYIAGSDYYLGLFSVLSGTVENIKFLNNKVEVTNSDNDYGKTFYVGMVAGRLNGGKIKNVISNAVIDLGEEALGTTYAGGIAGLGKGEITNVGNVLKDNYGKVNGNSHNFNNRAIIPKFYVGGLLGTNDGNILISDSFNNVDVIGVSSTNDSYQSVLVAESFAGGIIGEVNNITETGNSLKYLTNSGSITSGKIVGKSSALSYSYAGGIFGNLIGYGFELNSGSNVKNGRLENKGTIKGSYINNYTRSYLAGIGVVSASEANAEVSYVINKAGFEISNFGYRNHNQYIYYAATTVDNTTTGFTLSRAYNTYDFEVLNNYFSETSGTNPTEIKLAFFFSSVNDANSILKYVVNYGELKVGDASYTTNVSLKLKISNITQANKLDYYNVTNSGDVKVLNINNTNDSIYVSGIAWILAYINRPYQMRNVINEGDIITAGIKGNTTVQGTVTGTSFAHTTFLANLNVRNLYVAGIVNLNVGEIVNAFNIGKITSYYSSNVKDINGTANTFVGGINTFNYNLIQDAANSGLIEYTNSSASASSYFAATTNMSSTNNSTFGGISITYTGGLVLGGIVGALGDISGTELTGYKTYTGQAPVAQVLDTANNGDVFGKAMEYVRSGGILGIALGVELASGTYENRSTGTITAGPFTTAVIGSGDPVGQSLLSNGLNYGNIYAVTANVGNYGTTFGTGSGNTDANAIRPGINAVAGGVIAYGLTRMVRMLNHGVVSSTDVAGGIVGSTYILGGTSQATTPVTTVEINTAVHYGQIKAIKIGAYNNSRVFVVNMSTYNAFTYNENENFNNSSRYYQTNEYADYIYYRGNTTNNYIETYQQARRGFGGIFGRLQRGNYGTMRSTVFRNVMNMDANIDMIGRVDSNLPGSLVYYRFFTGEETYYTAKVDDKTPNAFAGWTYSSNIRYNYQNATVKFTVRRSGSFSTYYVTDIEVLSPNTVTEVKQVNKVVMRENATSTSGVSITYNTPNFVGFTLQNNTTTSTNYRVEAFGLTAADYGTLGNNETITFTKSNYTYYPVLAVTASNGSTSTPPTTESLRYPIRKVTDDPNTTGIFNIFHNDFPLMQTVNAEFIYAVEVDSLADRFQVGGSNPKPNGMYVLSSTTGSIDGASLPTNIKVTDLYKLDEDTYKYIDLDNVDISDKVIPLENDQDEVLYQYIQMYQLSYNNKSEVLAEDEALSTKIAELVLYDPNGNAPILRGGVINRNTNEITYTLSTTAFQNDNLYYEVYYNELSKGAIIAKSPLTNNEYNTLKADYENRENDILPSTSSVKWSLTGTLPNNSTVSANLRVYSEIYIKDQNIRNQDKYYTDYTIRIVRNNTTLQTNATINLNGTNSTHNNIADSVAITNRTMPPAGNLMALFTGTNSTINNLIPNHHEMSVRGLYVGSVNANNKIDESFYELEIIPKGQVAGNANQFGFNVILSDQLQAGTYIIQYGYYDTSPIKTITFTKRVSTERSIINGEYNYYSKDALGEDTTFTIESSNSFKSYIEFGYELPNVTTTNQTLQIQTNYYNNPKHYQDNVHSYQLSLGGEVLIEDFVISPFARLLQASIRYQYITQNGPDRGKKQYIVTYSIQPESGAPQTVNQTIEERTPTNINIYLDSNLQASNVFSITREAIQSLVEVDFNLIDNNLYTLMDMNIDNVLHQDNEEVFLVDGYGKYSFVITSQAEVGTSNYQIVITRENNTFVLGEVIITKNKGVSAYLLDVKFEGLDGGLIIKYPTIRPSNNSGEPNDSYDTRFFSEGIDYVDAMGSVYQFRIDGEVSDIDLENYSPGFILPFGARIQRYDPVNGWTPLTSDVNDLSLKTDYVGLGDVLEIIQYRVVPEENAENDYSNSVTYFVTTRDVKYNLTLRFKIYYNHPNLGLIEANNINSPVNESVILIALKNLEFTGNYPTSGNKVTDFPNGINFTGALNNQSSLYYFVENDGLINYRFGRNSTGAYNFNVVTPKYLGAETQTQTPNERYTYDMFIIAGGVTGLNWYHSDYKLPAMNSIISGNTGKFYYVYSTSPNPITRELAIVINPETQDKKWGLYDDITSFD